MVTEPEKIICPSCQQDTGFTDRGLMHYVLPNDGLKCPGCGHDVISKTQITWGG